MLADFPRSVYNVVNIRRLLVKKDSLIHQVLRLPALLTLVVTFFAVKAAAAHPAFVEAVYSERIYPFIRNAVSSVTRQVGFSVAEIIVGILILLFVVFFIIRLIRLLMFKSHGLVRFISLIITAVLTVSAFITLFYIMWGFNYFRSPVADKLALPDREYTAEEIKEVCLQLAEKAAAARAELPENDEGVFSAELEDILDGIEEAYADFGSTRPTFRADVPKAKPLVLSQLLSDAGISGMFIPFTEEPSINRDEPSLFIPFNAAHETAHYLGWAHEEDANFIAFIVAYSSENDALKYSGCMHALNHLVRVLKKADAEGAAKVYSLYTDAMKRDNADYAEYYEAHDTSVREASDKVNDAYLKFNEQEKGVLSYEEDVALILRYFDSRGFFED